MARSDDAGGAASTLAGRALRVFVAVPLAPPLRAAVAGLQQSLRARGGRLRWVEPGNLHVTLRFLGSLPEARVDDVAGALEEASRQVGPFLLELGSCGRFPGGGAPRVLWVGITGGVQELTTLAGRLEEGLRKRGFAPEDRGFRPHVTVARVREGDRPPGLDLWLQECAGRPVGSMRVEAVHVMASQLRPQGPLYRSLRVVPLSGGSR